MVKLRHCAFFETTNRLMINVIVELDAKEGVFFVSSIYSRTLQSALAFASTFFFPNRHQLVAGGGGERLRLTATNTTYFCTRPECMCAGMRRLRNEFELVAVVRIFYCLKCENYADFWAKITVIFYS